MKKNIIVALVLSIAAILVMSCFPDEHLVFSGETQVEFKNHTIGQQTAVLAGKGVLTGASNAQTDSTRSVSINTRVTDTVFVQLVGPQKSTAITVNYTLRASSTAIEGTHYDFNPVGARSVTIPANSSVGYVLIDMIPAALGASSFTVGMDLTGNESIKPNPNYDVFIVTIKN